jgi:hypothetical protein
MSNCWAACLSGCSDKISREHLISENLFLDDQMTVEGFPWCNGKQVKIGLAGGQAFPTTQPHQNKKARAKVARASRFNCPTYFSHPLQEAQHSAESQHDVVAAFTAPVNPSAITANNRTAASFFMDFLL